ncbi:MAG: hypothetical protein ABJC66_06765 [Gammaproteobacteria bacterium]
MLSLSCRSIAAPAPAAELATGSTADVVSSEWQHHKLTFNYVGFTTLYTCDGLEDHVRQLLLHLGARKDLKVRASGCPGPFNSPSRSAWVNVDFYALVPAAEAPGSDTVKAQWTALELTPRRPNFMGGGDCELIQGMKDLITKNFSLRSLEYRTSCFPNEVTLDGFSVKGQALRALQTQPSAVTG